MPNSPQNRLTPTSATVVPTNGRITPRTLGCGRVTPQNRPATAQSNLSLSPSMRTFQPNNSSPYHNPIVHAQQQRINQVCGLSNIIPGIYFLYAKRFRFLSFELKIMVIVTHLHLSHVPVLSACISSRAGVFNQPRWIKIRNLTKIMKKEAYYHGENL